MLAKCAAAHEDNVVPAGVFLGRGSASTGVATILAHADEGAAVKRAEGERVFVVARHLRHSTLSYAKSAFQNEVSSRVASAEGRPSPAAQAAGRRAGTGSAKRARRDTGRSIAEGERQRRRPVAAATQRAGPLSSCPRALCASVKVDLRGRKVILKRALRTIPLPPGAAQSHSRARAATRKRGGRRRTAEELVAEGKER